MTETPLADEIAEYRARVTRRVLAHERIRLEEQLLFDGWPPSEVDTDPWEGYHDAFFEWADRRLDPGARARFPPPTVVHQLTDPTAPTAHLSRCVDRTPLAPTEPERDPREEYEHDAREQLADLDDPLRYVQLDW